MTVLQLAGGKEIRVPESYEKIRSLYECVLANSKLLEFARSDGTMILINPNNVTFILREVDDYGS